MRPIFLLAPFFSLPSRYGGVVLEALDPLRMRNWVVESLSWKRLDRTTLGQPLFLYRLTCGDSIGTPLISSDDGPG